MSRLILYVSVATFAFIVGVAANWSVNTFGGFAVDKLYVDEAVDLNTYTILPGATSIPLPVHSCGRLVVSVTADGALKLNTMPMGTLNDTGALTATLRTLFEWREELHVYVPSPELSSGGPVYPRIEKTVYIRASRSIRYGEVEDLIAALKEAGADPIGLISTAQSQP